MDNKIHRSRRLPLIFQEPNAALNPIMTIGNQVAESFLFHRKDSMYKKISQELQENGNNTFSPLKKYLQKIYKTAAENPNSFLLKFLIM